MSRWEPNASGRLQEAALELYAERGFDGTTVAEIAGRAGLTERTFFRYFADKREVLFRGAEELEAALVARIESGPGRSPLGVVVGAFVGVATDFFDDRRPTARPRQAVIASSAELRERELSKFASLGVALAAALGRRGVAEPGATLAAEAGVAVFRIAFDRWIGADHQSLAELLQDTADRLASVTSEPG